MTTSTMTENGHVQGPNIQPTGGGGLFHTSTNSIGVDERLDLGPIFVRSMWTVGVGPGSRFTVQDLALCWHPLFLEPGERKLLLWHLLLD